MKMAKTDRYKVERIGTPDPPTSEYFVLDLVHDFEARVAVARLGTNYERIGQNVRAEECRKALADTVDAHQAACEAKLPKGRQAKLKKEDRRA